MKTLRVLAFPLLLAILATTAPPPVAAQSRSPRRTVSPLSSPVAVAPGQKARLVVGLWDLDNDGTLDSKGGVTLTLKFLPYALDSSEGGVARLKQVGTHASSPVFVPVGQVVKFEWDLDNNGQFGWDLNNDGMIRAAIEGAGFNDKGTSDTYRIYDANRTYALTVALEIVEKATGKVILRLGGQDWE